MKKLLSLMLALVMVLSMTTAVFADTPTYSITIKNDKANTNVLINGQTYKVYKLFDMTHEATTDETFAETLPVAYTVDSDFTGLTYPYKAANETTETIYTGSAHPTEANSLISLVGKLTKNSEDLDAFAKKVWEYIDTNSIAPDKSGTANAETITINVDAPGYYLVYNETITDDTSSAKVVAACALSNTDPDAEVNVKVEAPTIDKEIVVDETTDAYGNSYSIGDTVDFKITSNVPVMTGYETYTYVVTDTFSSGLTFDDKSLEVKVGTTELSNVTTVGEDASYTLTTEGQKITITFNNFIKLTEGDEIVITYSAKINGYALTRDVETNSASLKYSNDPYADDDSTTTTTDTPIEEVKIYDFDIKVDKFETDKEESKKLSGAKFVLLNEDKNACYYYDSVNEDIVWTKITVADGSTLVDTVKAKVDERASIDVKTTDDGGVVTFKGLAAGTYYLLEIEAPNGYNLLKDPKEVKIIATYNEDGSLDTSVADSGILQYPDPQATEGNQYYVETNVENSTGTLLPTTGGIGTVIFYLIGGVLVLGSVVLLVTKKRMSANK